MKAGLVALSTLALAGAAVADPHRHHVRHAHNNEKRGYVTEVEWVTVADPEIVIWVDQNGKPLSTVTNRLEVETPAVQAAEFFAEAETVQTPEPVTPTPEAKVAPPPSSQPPPPPPEPTPEPQPAPAPEPAPATGGFPLGIAYAPYTLAGCKDANAVLSDFRAMGEFGLVRIYGTDCDQVQNAVAAAKATNKKLILGVFNIYNVVGEVGAIVAGVKGDWSRISLVSIGNEEVNKGTAPAAVVGAVNTGRGLLRTAGYNGPVSTVDTFNQLINHPELCRASDLATANCHAFFTPSISAPGAGNYVKQMAADIAKACPGKQVLITESGWPKYGDSNGAAIPSVSNQNSAMQSIRNAFGNTGIVLFSAFDDTWKKNFVGSFNAEQHWGILG